MHTNSHIFLVKHLKNEQMRGAGGGGREKEKGLSLGEEGSQAPPRLLPHLPKSPTQHRAQGAKKKIGVGGAAERGI